MLKNYFKIAWRNLIRNKSYAFINILGLTLGVSVCLIIYLITSIDLSYDTFHPDKERIYRVVSVIQKADGVVTRFCIQDTYQLVDICAGGIFSNHNNNYYCRLPGNKGDHC